MIKIANETSDEEIYKQGFNCVEFGLLMARNAAWHNIEAEVFRTVHESGLQHMVLGFYSSEEGWVFVDPQTDKILDLGLGKIYLGSKVIAIDRLVCNWSQFIGPEGI